MRMDIVANWERAFRGFVIKEDILGISVLVGLCALAIICITPCHAETTAASSTHWKIGFGKTDVTPSEPVRLSGYGNRENVFEGVADRLNCRAMALANSQQDSETMLIAAGKKGTGVIFGFKQTKRDPSCPSQTTPVPFS